MEHPNQLAEDLQPLLALDLWEHAYYLDYKNNVEKYVNNYWDQVDWWHVERLMGPSEHPGIMEQQETAFKSERVFVPNVFGGYPD